MIKQFIITADSENFRFPITESDLLENGSRKVGCRTPLHALQIFSAFCLSNCQYCVTGNTKVCSHQHDSDILSYREQYFRSCHRCIPCFGRAHFLRLDSVVRDLRIKRGETRRYAERRTIIAVEYELSEVIPVF